MVRHLNFNEKFTADRARLARIIINLINNASKYSPDSTEIRISTELDNHEIILSIQDYGIGIAEEKQAMICEQFIVCGIRNILSPAWDWTYVDGRIRLSA